MGGSDLYVAGVYAAFVVIGFASPFAFTLGYLWVDTFYPQFMSTVVSQVPSSLIMGIAAMGGYLLLDRCSPPPFSAHTALALLLAAWMTLSNTWAVWPASAWGTWDWSFKTVIFAVFMTFVLRSRVQMEAFLQVFLFSAAVHMIAVGMKTVIAGSGYGRHLDVVESDAGLFETSYLAGASIALIPIILFLRKHAILIPKSRFRDLGYYGMIGVAVFAAMGTYARTALIGFLVVGVFLWLQSRRKILFTVCAVAVALAVAARTAETWSERIETTADYSADSSALGRILVWEWTIKFALNNPLGGGFDSFMTNHIEFPGEPGQSPQVIYGKAFHNSYIAVLGEQGFPGLAMFLTLQGMSLLYLWRIGRRTKNQPHLLWVHDLAGAAMTALLTIMACSCFIDIAYHSFVWYLMTFPVCLNGYLYRVDRLERGAAPLPWAAGASARPALPAAARMARAR
jgi:probable O-glycosylation ligase (exosortase A-associated)